MRTQEEIYLDVRSGSVGVALVEKKSNLNPRIIFSTRRQVPLQKEFDTHRMLPITLGVVRKVLEDVRERQKSISVIHLTMGSPWFTSQTRTVMYKTNANFRCTKELVANLKNKEQKNFVIDHLGGGEYEIVESDLMQCKINGYVSRSPIGKEANSIELTFYFSAVDKNTSDNLSEVVRSIFYNDVLNFHTFASLSQRATSSITEDSALTYLLVDIGGEVSELSVISGFVVVKTVSFPLGAHSIVRQVSKHFKTSIEEAVSLYEAAKEGRVSVAVEARIAEAIDYVKIQWQTYFKGVLEKLSAEYILPRLVIVVGNPNTNKILSSIFEGPDVTELLGRQALPEIRYVGPSDYKSKYSENQGRRPADIFLVIEVIALDIDKV